MTEAASPAAALTRSMVRDLLDRHDLGPSRALGQNFLCDPGTVGKIVRLAEIGPGDRVIEIGPGLGSLTLGLCAAGAAVTAIEVDRYLIPALREVVGHHEETGQLRLIVDDIRSVDWPGLLREPVADTADASRAGPSPAGWTVVANLPYNIATPLVLDLLADRPELTRFLVMVQREAGERLVAEPGSRTYGIPSVLRAYWATARIVGSVGADLFLPRPNVESVLVRIDRRDPAPDGTDFDRMATLVRAGFGQRRKMVRRSLAELVDDDQLARAGIDPTERPEQIGVERWIRLATP